MGEDRRSVTRLQSTIHERLDELTEAALDGRIRPPDVMLRDQAGTVTSWNNGLRGMLENWLEKVEDRLRVLDGGTPKDPKTVLMWDDDRFEIRPTTRKDLVRQLCNDVQIEIPALIQVINEDIRLLQMPSQLEVPPDLLPTLRMTKETVMGLSERIRVSLEREPTRPS